MQHVKIALIFSLLQTFFAFSQKIEVDSTYTDEISVRTGETPPPPYFPPFHSLDSIARTVKYEGNLARTAYELTKNYTSQTDKTRAIFTWVAHNIAYDYKAYNKNEHPKIPDCKGHDDCAEKYLERENDYLDKILRRKKAICEGYSLLFKRMCGHAGIQCSVVPGYVKTSANAIGKMGSLDHAWNIVIIDDKPYYLDVTWAAGFCTRNDKGELDGFVPNFNSFYWLMPQEKFRLEHFPKDTIWPFTSTEDKIKYRDQPFMSSHFHQVMEVLSPETGVLKVQVGECIKFKLDLRYLVDKIQINTNVIRNPTINWGTDENGDRVADSRILARQKYVPFTCKNLVYEFEYEVQDSNLRSLELLFDYKLALKFKVEVQKTSVISSPSRKSWVEIEKSRNTRKLN